MFLRPDELVSTATCRAGGGVEAGTGEILSAAEVAERVGWALGLTKILGRNMLERLYTPAGLAALESGVGPDGRALPSNAYMAGRRLGWGCGDLEGVYFSDRFARTVEEQVVRRLRQSVWLARVIDGLLVSWPANPKKRTSAEWDDMWKALPEETDKATARNRTRQIAAYHKTNGVLPAGIYDLEPTVSFGPTLLLAAADRQMVSLTRHSDRQVILRVQLPQAARPSKTQWSWVCIEVALPASVPTNVEVKTPTLRLVNRRVRVDLPWVQHVPKAARDGHTLALGFDWGVNTFITAAIAYQDPASGHVHADGKPLAFRTDGATAKVHRLRCQREVLHTKIRRIEALAAGLPKVLLSWAKLMAKAAMYQAEADLVSARQSSLNHQISWSGARWIINQAIANGATAIYGEDLSTMESSGLGTKTNTRNSNAVRSELLRAVRHLARRAGITVVTVPARGTSAQCPRCLARLHHCPAPDLPTKTGHKWSMCRPCGFSADRDHSAAERIVSRGLAAQEHVRLNGSTGNLECRTAIDVKVRRTLRSREKRTATPAQPDSSPRVRSTSPGPATPNTTQGESQRPAGTCPTSPAAPGSETRPTVQAAQRRRYHRHRKALGYGFHANAYSTPVVPRPTWTLAPVTPPPERAIQLCLGN